MKPIAMSNATAAGPFPAPDRFASSWERPPLVAVSRLMPPLAMQRIIRDVLVVLALLLLNKAGNVGAGIFFTILACMVLYSPQAAFKALAICWLGLMINQAFVPKSLFWTPARLALPLLAFVRFSFDLTRLGTSLFVTPYYAPFALYVLVMAGCSVLSGWYTQIALTKLLNFWAVTSAILAGTTVLRRLRVDITEWLVSLVGAATLLGLVAVATGAATRQGGMFMGAFLHSNCHSVYASLFVVFLASIYLLGEYPRRRIAIPLIAIWVVFMIWSKARASVLATVVGTMALLVLAQPFRNRFGWRLRLNMRRSSIVAYLVLAAAVTGVIDLGTGGGISGSVIAFINKGSDAAEQTELDSEQILASRRALIDRSWANFEERWLTGIGFQVGKDEAFVRNATWLTAPSEKGFLVTAVLEEGGVVGATAFVFFLLALVGDFFAKRNIPAIAVFLTFLTSNLAEVTMFSPGGSGAFGWAMIGAAMILSDHCWHRPQLQTTRLPR